jgi:hypothetical protein
VERAAARREFLAQQLFHKPVKLLLLQAPDIEPSGAKRIDDNARLRRARGPSDALSLTARDLVDVKMAYLGPYDVGAVRSMPFVSSRLRASDSGMRKRSLTKLPNSVAMKRREQRALHLKQNRLAPHARDRQVRPNIFNVLALPIVTPKKT